MTFREATDSLCDKVDHEDIARALGVSVQTIRQARLAAENAAHREEPADWENGLIRIAEERVWHYRQLIEKLREQKSGTRNGGKHASRDR